MEISNKTRSFFFRRMDGMIALRKGLDAMSMRQKALASNVANSETPGYVAKRVAFEGELAKAFDKRIKGIVRTSEEHIPVRGGLKALDRVQPEVVNDPTPMNYNGVNNVDIEKEMATMATNQIHYQAASKIMGVRFKMLRSAIMGRPI